jgi:hypothetical protein
MNRKKRCRGEIQRKETKEGATHSGQPLHYSRDVLLKGFPPLFYYVWVHVTKEVLLGEGVDDTGLGWI